MAKKNPKVSDLKQYSKNPRKITDDELVKLQEELEELGDLSGIVHDVTSNEVIGGNQRSKIFKEATVTVTEQFDKPTKTGTVAWGYVEHEGERYTYRQVKWTSDQCMKANIIANKAGGKWDDALLMEHFTSEDLKDWWFEDYELAGIGFTGIDFTRPTFENDADGSDGEGKIKEDEKYFYIEYYGDQQTYDRLRALISSYMKNAHEVDGKFFELAVTNECESRATKKESDQ